jgi:hypothetical protein
MKKWIQFGLGWNAPRMFMQPDIYVDAACHICWYCLTDLLMLSDKSFDAAWHICWCWFRFIDLIMLSDRYLVAAWHICYWCLTDLWLLLDRSVEIARQIGRCWLTDLLQSHKNSVLLLDKSLIQYLWSYLFHLRRSSTMKSPHVPFHVYSFTLHLSAEHPKYYVIILSYS